jgi:predicted aspartyl protease
MWARRFLIDTGATEADLCAVAMAQRVGCANERASGDAR